MDKKYRVVEHPGGGVCIQKNVGVDEWKNIGALFYLSIQGAYAFFRSRNIRLEDVDFSPVELILTQREYYNILTKIKDLQQKLEMCDNNHSYYMHTKSLIRWLDKMFKFFQKSPASMKNPDRHAVYKKLFEASDISSFAYYELVLNSYEDFIRGNKPFNKAED